jgi:hypothetical protein
MQRGVSLLSISRVRVPRTVHPALNRINRATGQEKRRVAIWGISLENLERVLGCNRHADHGPKPSTLSLEKVEDVY